MVVVQDDTEWAGFGNAEVATFQTTHLFTMNFPEIVDIALPAEGVFHNLVFVSIRKTYPMQASKVLAACHHARPLEHLADDVHQIHRGGGRICARALSSVGTDNCITPAWR
jgi:hypothetical protein